MQDRSGELRISSGRPILKKRGGEEGAANGSKDQDWRGKEDGEGEKEWLSIVGKVRSRGNFTRVGNQGDS